jgi:16S rRNA (adenine1518-N6/adenine1519-N6)-dimethyltransferase
VNEPFPDARELLRRHGLSAKKSWGQNFLVSPRVFRCIADAVVHADDDWVVEIGAGLGTLTAQLAQRVPEGKVFAIERDRDMVAVLRAELGALEDVEIVEDNALTFDLARVARWHGGPVVVCGNLPYHIASQLLFRLIDLRLHVARAVVMVQRELAERLLAAPGSPDYSAAGALIGTYADLRKLLRVGPDAFVPRPKVESMVIELTPLPAPRVAVGDAARYAAVVHAAFGQRRKTLRNALRAVFDGDAVDRALAAAGIDGGRRGETLDRSEFAALASGLGEATGNAR